jgi:hypothetical protein
MDDEEDADTEDCASSECQKFIHRCPPFAFIKSLKNPRLSGAILTSPNANYIIHPLANDGQSEINRASDDHLSSHIRLSEKIHHTG